MPHAGTTPAELLVFIRANSDTQEWSWFLASGPGLLFGPWFLGVLTAHLWHANPEARYLTAAGFSTALTATALFATAATTWGLFVYLGTQITDPSLLLVLAESRHLAEGAIGFPIAGAVAAYSLASKAHLPGWRAVVILGALAAGLQLAAGIDDFVVDGVTGLLGPAAFVAFLAWLAATSLALSTDAWQLPLMRRARVPWNLKRGDNMHRRLLAFLIRGMNTGERGTRTSHRLIVKTLAALGVAGVLLGLAACGQAAASGPPSSPANDFANTVEKYHLALGQFAQGNPEPVLSMTSQRDDVTLGNPLSPLVRGHNQVDQTVVGAAAFVKGGHLVGVDVIATYISGDLAVLVEVEHYTPGPRALPPTLRATIVFRRENGAWKVVNRLADFPPPPH